MCRLTLIIFGAIAIINSVTVSAKTGYGPGKQDYGFVDVRNGAHIFYWLYYTTAYVSSYTERPLTIWLQGGPGASSTGYGNFEELGPFDMYGNYRNHTWVQHMNVLFIDNPVGSGFSYADQISDLTMTNNQIAKDLVSFMKQFLKQHPEFETVPLHIFCESYGGKMAPEFALELHGAIQRGEVKCNLTSVALGDPWTSPVDSVNAWAPLLFNTGIVDVAGYEKIDEAANRTEKYIEQGKWFSAFKQWSETKSVVLAQSKGVDFYNIEKPTLGRYDTTLLLSTFNRTETMYRTLVKYDIDEDRGEMLNNLMRGPVSKALEIPSHIKWGSQSVLTFDMLSMDFMKPVIHIVEQLLNNTDVKVSVFSGQLDLICATAGTVNWINKMYWNDKSNYIAAPRCSIIVNRILEGYFKESHNFAMFWINRAGHMVAHENPEAMSFILKKLTNYG